FAGLLLKFTEREPDIVPIGSLYYGDSGPHIVNRGTPAARSSGLGRLELVSQGEHLRQAADSLERARSVTQRELRAHTLASTFRALAHAAGEGILGAKVAQLAAAARDALASGVAVHQPAAFAAELRRMGDVLAPPSRDPGRPPRTAPPPATALPRAPATVEPAVVDVRTLLYRGERALHRARELREAAKQAPGDALRALVEEVCDLVALALESHA